MAAALEAAAASGLAPVQPTAHQMWGYPDLGCATKQCSSLRLVKTRSALTIIRQYLPASNDPALDCAMTQVKLHSEWILQQLVVQLE